ncbi:hypothetical protein ISS07_05510 [Candidatus Woesearchaeota archaeon]|nr:hypothetical protein [Candidatus Woesearchaeota archaeon]
MLSEKEKLEEELRFLKESFDIGVITEKEYERGKQQIDLKLKKLDADGDTESDPKEEPIITELPQDKIKEDIAIEEPEEKPKDNLEEIKEESEHDRDYYEDQKTPNASEIMEDGFEKNEDQEDITQQADMQKTLSDLENKKEITKKEDPEEKSAEEKESKPTKEEEISEEKKKTAHEILKEASKEEEHEMPKVEEEKSNKKIFYAIALTIIILGLGYFFLVGDNLQPDIENIITCSSDNDCKEENMLGTCTNPGQENAECSFMNDASISLQILNSKECFNCNPARVLAILKEFYPNLEISSVNVGSEQGNLLAENFNVKALPTFILNSSFQESHNYKKLSNAFTNVNENFLMKNSVSNANFFFEREETLGTLDLIVQEDQEASQKAEENLQEFLKAFESEVTYQKHNEKSEIATELGIKSFPSFLINNNNKFDGVHAADKIKENFCFLNKLEECNLELSKSLI